MAKAKQQGKQDMRSANLRPVKNHKEAVERGRAGGLSRSDAKRFAQRKNCGPKCPYYDGCPLITTSKTQFEGKCALKAIPPEAQHILKSLYSGPEGMAKAFMSLVARVILSLGKNPSNRELADSGKLILDGMRTMYGTKTMSYGVIEHKVELSITARDEAIDDLLKGYLAERRLKVVPADWECQEIKKVKGKRT